MEFQHLVPAGPGGAVPVGRADAPVRVLLPSARTAVHAVLTGVQHIPDDLQCVQHYRPLLG